MLVVYRTRTAWGSSTRQSLLLLSFPSNVFVVQSIDGLSIVKLPNSNHNVEGRPPSSLGYERTVGGETQTTLG